VLSGISAFYFLFQKNMV